jgi:two-component system, OmpR family, phosphate regulon sensor histidine kinase PhoR
LKTGTERPIHHRRDRSRIAVRAAITYLVAGAAWILLTDLVLYAFVHDGSAISRLETAKGWMFAAVSATAVYAITSRVLARLERSEATMRAVVDSIADGVLLVGADGKIVDANPAAARLLGVPDAQALVGVDPQEFSRRFRVSYADGRLVPPERFATERALKGEIIPPYKAVVYPASDKEVVMTATSAPIRRMSDGAVELVVSVLRDETEIDQLERTRDELFAAAAHSFKTPLAIIKGQAQLLGLHMHDDRARAAVGAIDRQCDKMDRLIQNLLAAARLRSKTLRFYPRAVDLAPVVAKVGTQMRRATLSHQIVEQSDGPAPTVLLDPDRFAQALRNLLDLAFETSPPDATVALMMRATPDLVRVGVRAPLLPGAAWDESVDASPGAFSPPPSGLHAGLRLERHVSEQLIRLQGGNIRREEIPSRVGTIWIEVPLIGGRANVTS